MFHGLHQSIPPNIREKAGVVATPVSGPFAGARECRPTDDERPLPREDLKQSLVGSVQDLVAEQAVDVILLDTVDMGSIRRDGMHCEVAVDV